MENAGLNLTSNPHIDYRSYAVKAAIDHFVLMGQHEPSEIITRTMLEMMHRGAQKVFAEIYAIGKPVVLDWHIEEWVDQMGMETHYRLHYRLIVAEFQKFYIPVFEYVDHLGEAKWKCPSCGVINVGDASTCGEKHDRAIGCGYPKGGLSAK